MLRWALLDLILAYCIDTLYLTLHTDIPCHNLLHWQSTGSWIRWTWPERRGQPHGYRDRYVRPEWGVLQQNEPGYNTTKTFTWPGWPPLQTRYFLFTAKVTPYVPTSSSPYFHYVSPRMLHWHSLYQERFW